MSSIVREMLKDYYSLDDNSRFDIDKAIASLLEEGAFSDDEVIILRLTMEGQPLRVIGKAVTLSFWHVSRKLDSISNRIASHLGDEYQDSKILREVEVRLGRLLTPEEAAFCRKVIKVGHPLRRGLNIFNFKVGKYGFIKDKKGAE